MIQKWTLLILALFGLLLQGQPDRKVDFTEANIDISIDPFSKEIMGNVSYKFIVISTVDSIFLDAQKFQFNTVRLNGKATNYINNGETLALKKKFKQGKTYRLALTYTAQPKQTVYFVGWQNDAKNKQIWTQGQGKYTSHWLPSFDDMTEKVVFDLNITFDKNYEVVANGKLVSEKIHDSLKTWQFDMQKPMSSYLLAFVIGNYSKKVLKSARGIPLELYYYPSDSLYIEPTYRYSKEIFDFLESEIGVKYPWQNYKQIPVRDFLYAGMENTGTTIFSDAYVIDSVAFKDRNFVNVNAHELAHQWFGNLVTEVDGAQHWLHEGFATYYALLAEKDIFGDAYFYWKLTESAQQLNAFSRNGGGEALTDPKASSLTFYDKGAWALVALRDVVGETNFRQGVKNFLFSYQFKNATVSQFLSAMEQSSGKDLSGYAHTWLYAADFPAIEAKEIVAKSSPEIASFFQLQQEMMTSSGNNEVLLRRYWDKPYTYRFKKEMISYFGKYMSEDFLIDAFQTNSWEIRQALVLQAKTIPVSLKKEFESLLDDDSYETQENALYKLWIQFPADRVRYLEKTKGIIGFPNKNIRLLWLTLAVLTKGYDEARSQDYFTELSGYTAPEYSNEIRQKTFEYLEDTFGFTDKNLEDLINATAHHSWQFRKFSRGLVDRLWEKEDYKARISHMYGQLHKDETTYIQTKINTK